MRFHLLERIHQCLYQVPTISGDSGDPGSPITIIDPQGRLETGNVMVFLEGPSGFTEAADNTVFDPNTISGSVPGVDPGMYTIEVQTALGQGLVFPETFTFEVI